MPPLDPAPRILLELEEDLSPPQEPGFVRLVRRRWVATYPDGSRSAPFVYDTVERKALDVVVMAAHYQEHGRRHVYLRSAVRPPLVMRGPKRLPLSPAARQGWLWELPAGLVEPEEETETGVLQAAQRELAEELGFRVELDALRSLGPSTLPAPGLVGEQHIYFEVEVNPERRMAPSLDGSALEHGGEVIAIDLDEALECCRRGEIPDGKSELALRRLRERLA
jgi:ADP-ribose pyrophosphatase